VNVGKVLYHSTHSEIDSLYKFLTQNKIHSFKGTLPPKLQKKVSNSCMYIARRNGTNSKPCEHCARVLSSFRIKKIKYTSEMVIDGNMTRVLVEARLRS
jgi:deoxycytidylate deaminase